MRGAPEVAAKALVLAIARRVVPQGRVVHLVLFSGPGDLVELRIRRGVGGLDDLLDFLALGFSGGTDFDAPLLRALDLLEERPLRQADVLVLTDGRGEAASWTTHRVQQARDRGVKVWSIVLGLPLSRGVRAFSDEVWSLDPRRAAEAVGLVRRFERRQRTSVAWFTPGSAGSRLVEDGHVAPPALLLVVGAHPLRPPRHTR